jgi:hydroxyethylthiazole kinase-like uncharacterized protein yjeF
MITFPHGTPVYLTDEIRRIETLAAAGPNPPQLMERAGRAAADLARELAGGNGKPIAVIAGPGNNGGDAFVLARHLQAGWFDVRVTFAGDTQKLSSDATAALSEWRKAGGEISSELPPGLDCALVVDGLFGIGLQRELSGRYAEIVSWINARSAPVLALDLPSGLEADSGRVLGCAVRAAHTITFIGLKPGLLTLDGPDHAGELHLAPLGLDASTFGQSQGSLIGREVLSTGLSRRALNSHKGTFGSVAIVGGAPGMLGAPLLAGRAALKLGAGRVYVGLLDERAPGVDPVQPELMLRSAAAALDLEQITALAVGPGLGLSAEAQALTQRALLSTQPLVLDADALNLLAAHESLRSALARRSAATLLTPHPAEAARLLGVPIADVQHDRVRAAVKLARTFRCGIVLKGAGSVCAWTDGRWAINTSGNPGMASAGMGDVLTGLLASLLAQGAAPDAALATGVWLHGAAADTLAASGTGPVGLAASETIDAARALVNGQ